MKATVLPENLIPYLSFLSKLLPSHSQIPILSNILVEAKSDGLHVRATDLEMGGEVLVPAKIDQEGSITIPGKEFIETINSLPKDKITIGVEKDVAVLTCRGNKIVFNTIPSQEFPQLYKEKGEKAVVFGRKEFIDVFANLTFSVSLEETRPQLTGIYIDEKDSGVNFVSTDGYRMSVKSVSKGKKVQGGLIIPVKLIEEIVGLKGEDDIVLYINKNESQVIFEVGNVIVLGRMIEGQFPDYERVMPTDSKTSVIIDREELLRNVRLSSIFAKESGNIVNIEVKDEGLRLTTRSQGVGEGEMMVECEKEGDDNKISFNIKYLSDFLKNVDSKSVVLRLNSPAEPALFEVKEKNLRHVIMPIQVD